MMGLRHTPSFIAALVALFVVACSSSDGGTGIPTTTPATAPTANHYAERGLHGVGVTTLELVDTSRPTAANREYPGAPERRLVTEIWYPAPASAAAPEQTNAPLSNGGPFPLIIFEHGLSSFRRQSASFAQHLASHGYVVVSPDFPDSNIAAPGGARILAVLEHPHDVSFVIDELLRRSAGADWLLAGGVDGEHIGVTGHSLGGLSAMMIGYGDLRDTRIDAIAPISPVGCMLPDDLASSGDTPTMVIGGSMEIIVPPPWIRFAYDIAGRPKYFVEIVGGDHIRFADIDVTDADLPGIVQRVAGEDLESDAVAVAAATGADLGRCGDRGTDRSDELISGERQRELLRVAATPFFDAYLRDDDAALRFLLESLPAEEGIRFEAQTEE
jgi:predicted dienelactone hydrolase